MISDVARQLHVSPTTIRRWCKQLNLPHSKRYIDSLNDSEWTKLWFQFKSEIRHHKPWVAGSSPARGATWSISLVVKHRACSSGRVSPECNPAAGWEGNRDGGPIPPWVTTYESVATAVGALPNGRGRGFESLSAQIFKRQYFGKPNVLDGMYSTSTTPDTRRP